MEPNQSSLSSNPAPSQSPAGNVAGPSVLFKNAWDLYKRNWKTLSYLVGAPLLILYAGQFLNVTRMPSLEIMGLLLSICGLVMAIAMQGALADTISKFDSGQTAIKVNDEYKFGFSIFWSMVFLAVLSFFFFLGSFVIFVIPAIVLGIYGGMYVYARVLDGKKGFSAFMESYSLVKGRWWGVFGRMLYIAAIYIVLAIVVGLVGRAIDLILGFSKGDAGTALVSIIASLFIGSFFVPVISAYTYKLYRSLQSTRPTLANTKAFKNWLITFLVIGIVAMVLLPIFGFLLLSIAFMSRHDNSFDVRGADGFVHMDYTAPTGINSQLPPNQQ